MKKKLSGNKSNHPKKQFCKYGHSISVTGRYKDGHCIPCANQQHDKYNNVNVDKLDLYFKDYYDRNKKKILIKNKKYRKAHPELWKLNDLKKKSNRAFRIPKFGQKGILEFYRECPKNKTIDHIIPLQGELVSGLHVRWNLQYLTLKQNSKKGNRINLISISKQYGKLLKKMELK